ncbi:MAG: helix-turn-helix domain-containing protein [Pseudomonadota bacterium]
MTQTPERAEPTADNSNVMPFRDVNAETAPRRIADQLVSARLSRGLELEDVAAVLHIRLDYLQAIEEARFDDLPGPTYVAGFVRTYGKHLGLDGEELVRLYKDESGGVLARQNLYFPVPASETRRPTGRMIAIALLVVVVALAAWYAVGQRDLVDLEQIPPVPDFLAETSTDDGVALEVAGSEGTSTGEESSDIATATGSEQTDIGSDDVETLFTGEEPVDTGTDDGLSIGAEVGDVAIARQNVASGAGTDQAATIENELAETTGSVAIDTVEPEPAETTDGVAIDTVETEADALPEPPEPETDVAINVEDGAGLGEIAATTGDDDYVPRVYGRTNTDSRVELRAVETSWVQIEAPGNQVLLTRVLAPGDTYRVPNTGDIMLKTGNAGGLEVRVDGELIGSLGEQGEVIKDVLLEPDSLLER